MRACDTAPSPAVETTVFVLGIPVVFYDPAITDGAPALNSEFFPYVAATPLTPPPRPFLN